MNFKLLHVFSRCAVFEMENDSCFFSETPYQIFLNEKPVIAEQNHNVFSIYHLLPDTSYEVTVKTGGGACTQTIHTEPETFLLDVTRFGAVPDSSMESTAAIQAAILSCPDGGTVYIPKGVYHVLPLFLKSNMTLWLEKGAVLQSIQDRTRFPILPGVTLSADEQEEYYLAAWEGNPLSSFASLITCINLENVNIIGQGTLDCNAQNGDWWIEPKKKKIAWRPRTIFLNHCKNVNLQGITLQNSFSWTLHSFFCKDLRYLDLRICNPSNSPNTDGIDPEACQNLEMIGIHISVGDDCIALKSGKLYLGEKCRTPCQNVQIRNCFMERGHGGVVIGSEVAGGVFNVNVSQCLMMHTDRGLRIKTRRGRGKTSILNEISFENIQMDHVKIPFAVGMFYYCDPDGHSDYVRSKKALPVDNGTPKIGRLHFRNIHAIDAEVAGMFFYGLPEMPIDSIDAENVSIYFSKDAKPGFPEMMDDLEPMCRKGLFARNAKQLTLKQVKIEGFAGEKYDVDATVTQMEES